MHRASGAADQPNGSTDVEQVLARLGPDGLALDDPPADVWLGIAAALADERGVTSDAPRVAPAVAQAPPEAIEYEIDADDIVVSTDAAWAHAARAAGSPELETPRTDRTIWDAFGDAETRDLWQVIVLGVRASGTAMTVPLRCDSPDARRWFEMTVSPLANGHVHFRCALQFEDARPHVDLLDPVVVRSTAADALQVCSWCGRASDGGAWLEFEELLRTSRHSPHTP